MTSHIISLMVEDSIWGDIMSHAPDKSDGDANDASWT